MPPALSFSHFGLFVHDLARMEAFYTGMLGFFVTDRGDLDTPRGKVGLVFLSRSPDEHHQIILATGRPENLPFNVINQISFRADSLPSLKVMHVRMQQAGMQDLHTVTHGNALSIYVADPEGNRLEVFIDTPWYVDQPMRVPIDLTLPDDRLMAEAAAHAQALPGFRSRAPWRAEMAQMMGMP